MRGTTLDGVDLTLIETDGVRVAAFGPTGYRPYADEERALLRQALADGATLTERVSRPGILKDADEFVTRVHAETVEAFIGKHGIDCASVAVVGFHVQTVIHKPASKLTVQIGDGAATASLSRLASAAPSPICTVSLLAGLWITVCPWKPTTATLAQSIPCLPMNASTVSACARVPNQSASLRIPGRETRSVSVAPSASAWRSKARSSSA